MIVVLINFIKKVFFVFIFLLNFVLCGARQLVCNDACDNQCYSIIQSFLDQYKRSFTLLDVNANKGYYSLKAARDYDVMCVMIEANNDILEICKSRGDLNNIVLLNIYSTPAILQHLGECEHFDVILAMNGLRDFGEQWRDAFEKMFGLGDYLIVGVSSSDKDVEEYIIARGGQNIGTVFNGRDECITIYSIALSNNYLKRKAWLRSSMPRDGLYRIESSFTHKQLVKPATWPDGDLKTTSWIAGINLCTFKMCYGAYPTTEQLKNNLLTLKDVNHTDWLINNMIMQGATLTLIDNDDPLSKRYFSEALLHAHLEMLDIYDPAQVEHYFWYKLIKASGLRRQAVKFLSKLFPACSLVFDIESADTALVDRYLGYGAKIVCCNPSAYCIDSLYTASTVEHLDVVLDTEEEKIAGDLDSLIARYGKPLFCTIHRSVDVLKCLKTLSQPLDCIAYRFDVRCKADLKACLDHLVSLGYQRFNFSARDIPAFILESNRYTNTQKEWACSADELVYGIDEFVKLDYDGKNLWGYVFACYF